MKYCFKKLHIHHFLSFDDAIIDLTDRGYCLIDGINNNLKDAAKSNGSGKSTIANAIVFALLGETINGLKSNLSNIQFNDGCYVSLSFSVDSDTYEIIRSKDDKEYGTNLRIYLNGENKSGKGVRESQEILDNLLPDMTHELLGSVIILGQGLPDRFTANTPSGRKEVLEHLSKSDFMIQDLKKRIEDRSVELSHKLREIQDLNLKLTTQVNVYKADLEKANVELNDLKAKGNIDFNALIKAAQDELERLKKLIEANELKLNELKTEEATLTEKLMAETNLKSERFSKLNEQFTIYDKELAKSKWDYESQIGKLTDEIKAMKDIKDICPTCGQKIPNVVKPDTRQKEADLEAIKNYLKNIIEEIQANEVAYKEAKLKVDNDFTNSTTEVSARLTKIRSEEFLKFNNTANNSNIEKIKLNILSLEKDRDSYNQQLTTITNKIKTLNDTITKIEQVDLKVNSDENLNVTEHIGIVNKMNTYIKRDFRGILLTHSINYINLKAKEFSSKIFNTDEIEFKLDGNNIDISFCGKDYENLSGGEKQRIDLIAQFAIRDMLSKQLGFSSNILFLDEITDNLDKESCDKVIDFITDEFKDTESIFIISHHSDLDIPYDSQITVIKNSLGVSNIE